MIVHIVRSEGFWEAFDETGKLLGTERHLSVFRRAWGVVLHKGPNLIVCEREELVQTLLRFLD